MNNFFKRTLTGTLFVLVMVGCIWWSYWSMAALFFTISVLGLWEFYTLLEKANYFPQKNAGVILGSIIFGGFLFLGLDDFFLGCILFLPLIFTFFLIELFRNKDTPVQNIGQTILGFFYIIIPFILMVINSHSFYFDESSGHRISKYNPNFILGFFFLIWSNDTFAYIVGMLIGRHKLFERISPKKTWEGTIGGGILTLVVAYIISAHFIEITLTNWLIVALIVTITGTLGDLVESMFKRSLNVKDSGNILPGHGGILDRFDGVLFSSPFVFAYLLLIH